MSGVDQRNKSLLAPLRRAQYDFSVDGVARAAADVFDPHARVHLAHPLGDLLGPCELFNCALLPLATAFPDLERRDTIVMAGVDQAGEHWVGCCGYYTGTFARSWLEIPPTGHQAALRFHEFYRFENERVTQLQALWDIPELMLQAGVWPMAPSLGREWQVPGPASQDGLAIHSDDAGHAQKSLQLVGDMLAALGDFAEGGVTAMQLERYWHRRCNWYGPSGIGTGRGISGFRNWHQIPFLNAMPDRVAMVDAGHFFAEADYVGFTAWPGMHATISADGWLGIAPGGQKISLRSLDFWRCEAGLIRENWVLVDLLDIFKQLGVDVFARMREFNKARQGIGFALGADE